MSNKTVCPNCGTVVPDGSVFCTQCGEKIRAGKDSSAAGYQEATVLLQSGNEHLQSGTILHAKYRVNGVIGQGGFGITYDGTDLNLDMHVAIKEYFPNMMANRQVTVSTEVLCNSNTQEMYEQGMKNFLNEAKNMAKYAGEENFVTVHDYFTENNTAYIIMEFVEGITLKQYLKEHGKLTMDEAMPIIVPIMGALEKIHDKGMIHRDVSPSNIMVLPDGRVRLLDFGAVKEVSQHTQNLTAMSSVYKFGYSPIEQQTMGLRQGPFTDIYALCATIYEMLTGSVPPPSLTRSVEGDTLVPPSKLGAQISAEQERVLLKGLSVNGADRIQTIAELRNGLCGIAADNRGGKAAGAAAAGKAGAASGGGTGQAGGSQENGNNGNKKLLPILIAAVLVLGVMGTMLFAKSSGSGDAASSDAQETAADEAAADEVASDQAAADAAGEEMMVQEEAAPQKDARIPDDAVQIGANYYKIYHLDAIDTWQKAQQYCIEQGGHLAVITSDDLNAALYKLCLSQGFETAFFGFSDAGSEGNWVWVTQAQPAYRNWGPTEPNSGIYREDYAMFSSSEKNGTWNDSSFGHESTAFICQWGDEGIEHSEIEISIPDDAFVFEGHSYYLFDNGMGSWAEAEQYCKSLGGYMAIINNAGENEALYQYMLNHGYKAAFFGYSDKEEEGTWSWFGDDRSSFEDWGVNDQGEKEPNAEAPYEDYVEFSTDMHDGYWNDSRYGYDTHAYFCEWNTVQ